MARNSVVAALLVVAVIVGLASALGPSVAPTYVPAKFTVATAPTKTSAALIAITPEQSTISAVPHHLRRGPRVLYLLRHRVTPAPRSEAAEGPTGDYYAPSPIADTPADSPQSAGAALKVSPIIGVAAVVGSLPF